MEMENFHSPISFCLLPSCRGKAIQWLQSWKQLQWLQTKMRSCYLCQHTCPLLTWPRCWQMHCLWLPQACEILGQAFFGLVEFFLPPVTTAGDEQFKLIIQKFGRVSLAVYNTISLSQPLLPLPKHCSLYWGARLIKSCQSLEDACN